MKLKRNYDVVRDKHAYISKTINDKFVRVAAKFLAVKMVRKNILNQCTLGVIACTKKCVEGVQMNWSLFLLNQLKEDAMLVQEGKRSFTYSRLLIVIVLVGWMEPEEYLGMDVEFAQVCRGAKYKNLWYLTEKNF